MYMDTKVDYIPCLLALVDRLRGSNSAESDLIYVACLHPVGYVNSVPPIPSKDTNSPVSWSPLTKFLFTTVISALVVPVKHLLVFNSQLYTPSIYND